MAATYQYRCRWVQFFAAHSGAVGDRCGIRDGWLYLSFVVMDGNRVEVYWRSSAEERSVSRNEHRIHGNDRHLVVDSRELRACGACVKSRMKDAPLAMPGGAGLVGVVSAEPSLSRR